MLQCFANQTVTVNMAVFYMMKYLPKRESNLENVQSCPSNKKCELSK